ncbi:MAG: hypothetical protein P9L94_05235 [Candidatus Hinthialibacter antarcticus]|nr:hypothetical protein [Candidatus Hinthialibacter antarcticus]
MAAKPRARSSRSDFQLFLEFLGLKTILGISVGGGLYFYSGYINAMAGMSLGKAYSPFYVLRLHDSDKAFKAVSSVFVQSYTAVVEAISLYYGMARDATAIFLQNQVNPFIQEHPVLGFAVMAVVGFSLSILLIFLSLGFFKWVIHFFKRKASKGRFASIKQIEDWTFDPRRDISDDQLRIMTRNLEKLVHRAPALAGQVPKNADFTIKELARHNIDSDFVYRNAIYVMGPIKSTGLDNSYELPLTLDQVKRISLKMGRTAAYETLPLDLVTLCMKKGSSRWEVATNVDAIKLGKAYPVKILEKVLLQNRNYFIWDGRVTKSVTGYGVS